MELTAAAAATGFRAGFNGPPTHIVVTSPSSSTKDYCMVSASSSSSSSSSVASPSSVASSVASPSSSSASSASSSSSSQILNVSDEELANLSVRQLNQRLQGQDRQIVYALKQKRRTLKNRGYAFNCRVRRIQNQLQLEADNMMLRDQVQYLRQALHDLQMRLAYYEPTAAASASASVNATVCSEAFASLYPPPPSSSSSSSSYTY